MQPIGWMSILLVSIAAVLLALPLPSSAQPSNEGTPGTVTTHFGPEETTPTFGAAVAIQPDGKIVLVGSVQLDPDQDTDFALARYTATGLLDPTFGHGGTITTDFGPGDDFASAVIIQPDSKIVVTGSAGMGPDGEGGDFALVRYATDGSLDPSFGDEGKLTTDVGPGGGGASAVAIQSDGKIVLAGSAHEDGSDFALARYMRAGFLDPSFGRGGVVTTDFNSGDDMGFAVAIQSDGRLVVAGSATVHQQTDFGVARYATSGSLDPSFGHGGKITTNFGSGFNAGTTVALQPDGRIVVAGGTGTYEPREVGRFALARYTPAGSLDQSFGKDGKVTTTFADYGSGEVVGSGVVVQRDGKIVVVGSRRVGVFALVRYTPAGSLDRTFGKHGKVDEDNGDYSDLALEPDGKVVVAGGEGAFSLALYTNAGVLDPRFGLEGASLSPSASARAGVGLSRSSRHASWWQSGVFLGTLIAFALIVLLCLLAVSLIRRRRASAASPPTPLT